MGMDKNQVVHSKTNPETGRYGKVTQKSKRYDIIPFGSHANLRGLTPIDWDMGCAILILNFSVYFIACKKFLGQDFSLE